MEAREIPKGPVVWSSPLGGLSLHLPSRSRYLVSSRLPLLVRLTESRSSKPLEPGSWPALAVQIADSLRLRVPLPGPVLDGGRRFYDSGVHYGSLSQSTPCSSKWFLISVNSPCPVLPANSVWCSHQAQQTVAPVEAASLIASTGTSNALGSLRRLLELGDGWWHNALSRGGGMPFWASNTAGPGGRLTPSGTRSVGYRWGRPKVRMGYLYGSHQPKESGEWCTSRGDVYLMKSRISSLLMGITVVFRIGIMYLAYTNTCSYSHSDAGPNPTVRHCRQRLLQLLRPLQTADAFSNFYARHCRQHPLPVWDVYSNRHTCTCSYTVANANSSILCSICLRPCRWRVCVDSHVCGVCAIQAGRYWSWRPPPSKMSIPVALRVSSYQKLTE